MKTVLVLKESLTADWNHGKFGTGKTTKITN